MEAPVPFFVNASKVYRLILTIFWQMKNYVNIFQFMKLCIETATGPKPLCIRFDKTDRFIIVLGGKVKYLI